MPASSCLLLLVSIATISREIAAESYDLKIKPESESFTKPLKSAIVFTCEVSNVPDGDSDRSYNLKWFHGDKEITDRMNRMYVENEPPRMQKLYLTDIETEDQGRYTCRSDLDGETREKSVTLDLFKEITFDNAPPVQHPAIYTDALIVCQVSATPPAEVSWRYKGSRLSVGKNRYKQFDNGLLIENITLEDDGTYLCRAEVETEGRYSEQKINVSVHIPPVIVEGPGTAIGTEGLNMSISCKADGLPPPEFKFYKDGDLSPLVSSDRIKIDSSAGVLNFIPIKREDKGKYTCVAHNDVGNQSYEGEVSVRVKPSIYEFPNVSMQIGMNLTVVCASHGDPAPHMTIRKVGKQASYNNGDNEDQRIKVLTPETGRLIFIIDGLTIQDSGDYVCQAGSEIGNSTQTAKVTVTYRPRFPDDHQKTVYIWAGKTRNITCNVLAEPQPTISWFKGSTEISDNDTFHAFTSGWKSDLQVKALDSNQMWIYDSFICQAENELGMSKLTIELQRAIPPDSPQSVNVSECTPNSVVLLVAPPLTEGGERVTGYRVEYFEKMPNTTVSIDGESPDPVPEYTSLARSVEVQETNKIEIKNLNPNTTYTFQVKAVNEVGAGNPIEKTVTTDSVRKPNPIQITKGKVPEAYSYTLTWKEPVTGGRPIKQYDIKYRTVITNESGGKTFGVWTKFERTEDPDMPTMTFELENLSPKTTYAVEIRAKNEVGWSDTSEFEFQTREATPEEAASMQTASMNPGAIVGIVVVIFLVLLIIVDISCYFVNHCGVTMCICVHLCGKSATFTKEKAMEEGERQCLKMEDDKEKDKEELKEALKEGIEPETDTLEKGEVKIAGEPKGDEMSEKAPVV